MDDQNTLIGAQRKWFHDEIIRRGVLSMGTDGVASNADRGNKASIAIAAGIAARLMSETHERQAGQDVRIGLRGAGLRVHREHLPQVAAPASRVLGG